MNYHEKRTAHRHLIVEFIAWIVFIGGSLYLLNALFGAE